MEHWPSLPRLPRPEGQRLPELHRRGQQVHLRLPGRPAALRPRGVGQQHRGLPSGRGHQCGQGALPQRHVPVHLQPVLLQLRAGHPRLPGRGAVGHRKDGKLPPVHGGDHALRDPCGCGQHLSRHHNGAASGEALYEQVSSNFKNKC